LQPKREKIGKKSTGLWKFFPCTKGQVQAAGRRGRFHFDLAQWHGFQQNAMIKTIQCNNLEDEPAKNGWKKIARGAQGARFRADSCSAYAERNFVAAGDVAGNR